MEKKFLKMICCIKKIEEEWKLYDCTEKECDLPSDNRIFSRTIKTKYLKSRKKWQNRQNIETVWILKGIGNGNAQCYEQVGRSKCIINSLNEIREDIKEFLRNEGKYGKLKNKAYEEIVFYEIDIESYLKKDLVFNENFSILSNNENFQSVYYHIAAAYVEGKLGALLNANENMYHPSTLDGYFYEFFKTKSVK